MALTPKSWPETGTPGADALRSQARGGGRRRFLGALGGAGAALALGAPALAQSRPRVVVVGGGMGGAYAARRLAENAPTAQIALVTAESAHTTSCFSNLYLAGYRSLRSLTHGYDRLRAISNLDVVVGRATALDRMRKTVSLTGGAVLAYDRLVVATGVSFREDAVEGYDATAARAAPHGFGGGFQAFLLKRLLRGMREGGLFIIATPPGPYRGPAAPYERAALAAHLFQRVNPRAKILVLDAKNDFPDQALFESGWRSLYGEMIEWLPASATGGGLTRYEPASGRLITGDGGRFSADAACVIPPQWAGDLLGGADLTDDSGWAVIDPGSMRSRVDGNVFVLGDAARADPMRKTADSAVTQAEVCARAVTADLVGSPVGRAAYEETQWSHLTPQQAIRSSAGYVVADGRLTAISRDASRPDDTASDLLAGALSANAWYAQLTSQVFG